MHGIRAAGELLLLAALLLTASASAAVGANGGRVVISRAAAEGARASARLQTDTAPAALTRRLENEVAPEVTWTASVLVVGGTLGGKGYDPYNPNRQVCPPTGSCAGGPGYPYTPSPRPCYQYHYRC